MIKIGSKVYTVNNPVWGRGVLTVIDIDDSDYIYATAKFISSEAVGVFQRSEVIACDSVKGRNRKKLLAWLDKVEKEYRTLESKLFKK